MKKNEVNLDHWRKCDELELSEAVLLALGHDPSRYVIRDPENSHQLPVEFRPIFKRLKDAVLSYKIKAYLRIDDSIYGRRVFSIKEYEESGQMLMRPEPNFEKSKVKVKDFIHWLRKEKIIAPFFYEPSARSQNIFDKKHPRYAPKLAAAVRVWQAIADDETLIAGRSVKAAIKKWLELNSKELGLVQPSGKINASAIAAISKIVNWDPLGGAPKTPIKENLAKAKKPAKS